MEITSRHCRALLNKTDNLSSVPGMYMDVEGESHVHRGVSGLHVLTGMHPENTDHAHTE